VDFNICFSNNNVVHYSIGQKNMVRTKLSQTDWLAEAGELLTMRAWHPFKKMPGGVSHSPLGLFLKKYI
jgi:hypothetical protein